MPQNVQEKLEPVTPAVAFSNTIILTCEGVTFKRNTFAPISGITATNSIKKTYTVNISGNGKRNHFNCHHRSA